jgi:hypothetical protein
VENLVDGYLKFELILLLNYFEKDINWLTFSKEQLPMTKYLPSLYKFILSKLPAPYKLEILT